MLTDIHLPHERLHLSAITGIGYVAKRRAHHAVVRTCHGKGKATSRTFLEVKTEEHRSVVTFVLYEKSKGVRRGAAVVHGIVSEAVLWPSGR